MKATIKNVFSSAKTNPAPLNTDTKNSSTFGENLKTVFLAIFIALIIRSFFFEPFRIPSGSMYPTLRVGDYLFVSK